MILPKWKLYGVIGLVILVLLGWLQITRAKLETAELKRDQAIEQRDTMFAINKEILASQEKDAVLRQELYEDYKGARTDVEELREKFADSDLSAVAKGKPGLITRYARRATVRVLDDLEAAINQDTAVPGSTKPGPGETTSPSTDSQSN